MLRTLGMFLVLAPVTARALELVAIPITLYVVGTGSVMGSTLGGATSTDEASSQYRAQMELALPDAYAFLGGAPATPLLLEAIAEMAAARGQACGSDLEGALYLIQQLTPNSGL